MAKGRIKRVLRSVTSRFDQGWATIAQLLKPEAKGAIGYLDWKTQISKYSGTTYACIRKIATSVASVPLHLYTFEGTSAGSSRTRTVPDNQREYLFSLEYVQRAMQLYGREGLVEIYDHEALDLLSNVNAKMTKHNLLDMTVTHQELTGNCYWKVNFKGNGNGKRPESLWLLFSEYVTIEQNKDGTVKEYKYKPGKNEKVYKPEEIIHHWYPGPFSQVYGFSPVVAASRAINVEENIFKYQDAMFKNMGVIPAMIISEGRVGPEEKERFEKRWLEKTHGAENWFKIPMLLQGKMRVEKVGIVPSEMAFLDGAKMAREWIANDIGVPLSELTMESSNRAVADAGNTAFLRHTVKPRTVMIAEELTESLSPMYGEPLIWAFDDPVPEDKRQALLERKTNLSVGYSSPDEERAKEGLEGVPGGDKVHIPMNMVPLGSSPQMTEEQMDSFVEQVIARAWEKINHK